MALFDKSDSAQLVVLSLLAEGASYGYQLTKDAATRSSGTLRLTPGVLYPMLKSLETEGLITSSWEEIKAQGSAEDETGRRRKWYRISPKGRKRLEQRIAAHRAYTALIDTFLGGRPQEERP
ncbi:MAG: PadR family transcriptional regulator [Phycisphaerales bacterium]